MTLEILKTKEELRNLIDAYAYLGDDWKIANVMQLFVPEATYTVFMNGVQIAQTTGTDNLEKEFSAHASAVKSYFTLNGQHTVEIDGEKASGISYAQLKMVRETQDGLVLSDYSVRYEDNYVRRDGKWLIAERIGHFLIVESRKLQA
ncbi:nuclear transport factor 2 family protein [Flavobacterium sp.]|uniref:nuclear transport factor 2 family protein n=1 Tax=Flavobacterium sp. TaxID=239 RepID=UPI0011F7A426|nr:nuclear transport factor 2 family protein [Flavobacterium sp.]RZJ69229.1 MAG: nuclear transport factor 2 family protein [Flavobacterium sp.]